MSRGGKMSYVYSDPDLEPGPFLSRERAERAAKQFTLLMCDPCARFHDGTARRRINDTQINKPIA
jgi:hypothetical protein